MQVPVRQKASIPVRRLQHRNQDAPHPAGRRFSVDHKYIVVVLVCEWVCGKLDLREINVYGHETGGTDTKVKL